MLICVLLAAWSLAWWPWSPGWALWGAFYWLIGWWALVLALQVGLSQRANRAAFRAARSPDVNGAAHTNSLQAAPLSKPTEHPSGGAKSPASVAAEAQCVTPERHGATAPESVGAALTEPEPLPPIGALSALRVWLWACWVAPQVFFWRQPFRESRWPDCLPSARAVAGHAPTSQVGEGSAPLAAHASLAQASASAGAGAAQGPTPTADSARLPASAAPRAVLFVHGFVANRAFWNPWLAQLTAQGQPFVAHSIAQPFALLDQQASELTAVVDRIVQATGQPPLIVAHSMGGLVVRAWLRQEAQQGRDWRARVHRVAVLGSPLAGTGLARWGHTALSRQMRRAQDGGQWVPQLNADLDALGVPRALFACWASTSDNMVFPAHSALLAGADQHVLQAVPHVPLAFAPEVMAGVLALR